MTRTLTLLTWLCLQTKQRIMNWRRTFLSRALTAVKQAYVQFKREQPEARPQDVTAWAMNALNEDGGEAWFKVPINAQVIVPVDTTAHADATEGFQSPACCYASGAAG